jgi:hypothetical protein
MTALRDGLYRYLGLQRDPYRTRGKPPASASADARHALYEKPLVKQKREVVARCGYGAMRTTPEAKKPKS